MTILEVVRNCYFIGKLEILVVNSGMAILWISNTQKVIF